MCSTRRLQCRKFSISFNTICNGWHFNHSNRTLCKLFFNRCIEVTSIWFHVLTNCFQRGGFVCQAFAGTLASYLHYYRRTLLKLSMRMGESIVATSLHLPSSCIEKDNWTMLTLFYNIQHFMEQIKYLSALLHYVSCIAWIQCLTYMTRTREMKIMNHIVTFLEALNCCLIFTSAVWYEICEFNLWTECY